MRNLDTNVIMNKLEEIESRLAALEGLPRKVDNKEKEISLKEFILTKKPEDDVQKTLVIGYYLEHFSGEESFNVKDLSEGFRSAREPVPSNINDKVNLNIAKGHIMDAREKKDNRKAWVLTNTGDNFVKDGLKPKGK